jgi:hypothetical protein
MPHEEITGTRDRTYSAWHRRMSTRRFVGIERAQTLGMIDLDASLYVEYDDASKEPLALIETARDVGQEFKPATVTANLARRANLLACVLLYLPSETRNPADPQWPDIARFRVKRLWPNPASEWCVRLPEQWAQDLVRIRTAGAAIVDDLLNQIQ